MPNAVDRVLQMRGSRGSVGALLAESLPNITGSLTNGGTGFKSTQLSTNGCIVVGSSLSSTVSTASATAYNVSIDASRSSSTYQDNAPVQQNALVCCFCIRY